MLIVACSIVLSICNVTERREKDKTTYLASIRRQLAHLPLAFLERRKARYVHVVSVEKFSAHDPIRCWEANHIVFRTKRRGEGHPNSISGAAATGKLGDARSTSFLTRYEGTGKTRTTETV
jgi:hypothetical protein